MTIARELTTEEQEFCHGHGFSGGWDADDGEHQYLHVCWPGGASWGALCRSDRLWFYGVRFDAHNGKAPPIVDCVACLAELAHLRAADPVLLAAIGNLSGEVERLMGIHCAAEDLLFALDKPADAARVGTPEAARAELDAARAEWEAYLDKYPKQPGSLRAPPPQEPPDDP